MKFTLKNALKFNWEGLEGWAFNSKEDFENASTAYIEVTKRHGKVKTTRSDRVYFVVDGKGEFVVNGEKVGVEKNDVVIVPKNISYDYWATRGILKLFLVHIPAYHPDFETDLEKKSDS